MGVNPKIGVGPKWMVYFMDTPIKSDDLGFFPYFWKTPMYDVFSNIFFSELFTFQVSDLGKHQISLEFRHFVGEVLHPTIIQTLKTRGFLVSLHVTSLLRIWWAEEVGSVCVFFFFSFFAFFISGRTSCFLSKTYISLHFSLFKVIGMSAI